jgi:putative membrane protein
MALNRLGPRDRKTRRHRGANLVIDQRPMSLAATIATSAVGLLHLAFLILEMFLWDAPLGRKAFHLTPEFARATRVLAANQGLYNGFLAAGLFWGAWLGNAGQAVKVFFLSCVVVAGVFGALTSSRKILIVQGLPGATALLLVLVS